MNVAKVIAVVLTLRAIGFASYLVCERAYARMEEKKKEEEKKEPCARCLETPRMFLFKAEADAYNRVNPPCDRVGCLLKQIAELRAGRLAYVRSHGIVRKC